ncbi:hypothetical protein DYB34_004665 [Aphanomyces astaci]|uniref:tRNA-uridine aminocarboxypropyltransferase 1 n=1 Tax=Aphanomyces astaci TaxID=112090 RepID=A0A397A3M0_APHAT|nr:hypothetical protein DYB36_006096 [Aphanomyces astaci]RHY60693.1 hypothetical protein DYB34_004665 [Aphanomyces astaci]
MEPTIEPDVAAPATTANAALTEEWKREECPGCKKSSKYYCVNCYVPIGAPSTVQVPRVRLPLRVDILFQDKIKKSTAPHGKVVAPDDISIIPYPFPSQNPPEYDVKEAVVVYPSINAVVIDELEDPDSVKTLIFIDCPWQKAPSILHDPALSHLRCPRYHQPRVFDPLAVHLMLAEYSTAKQRSITTLPPPATESTASPTETTAPLLFFFHLLHDHIMNTHVTDPNRQVHRAPMSEEEKERRRLLRCQKESGKKRKMEHKQSVKDRLAAEIEAGVVDKWPKKCFNCNARTHEARECPVVCRHCKVQVHFNGDCPMKGQRGPAREPKITKAL